MTPSTFNLWAVQTLFIMAPPVSTERGPSSTSTAPQPSLFVSISTKKRARAHSLYQEARSERGGGLEKEDKAKEKAKQVTTSCSTIIPHANAPFARRETRSAPSLGLGRGRRGEAKSKKTYTSPLYQPRVLSRDSWLRLNKLLAGL